jgi:hypothetical protein
MEEVRFVYVNTNEELGGIYGELTSCLLSNHVSLDGSALMAPVVGRLLNQEQHDISGSKIVSRFTITMHTLRFPSLSGRRRDH